MSFEELEELIRKYLSTGIAVVVIVMAPGTGAVPDGALPGEPSVTVIEPDTPTPGGRVPGLPAAPSGPGPAQGGDAAPEPADPEPADGPATSSDSGTDDRTGAGGRDPDQESGSESGRSGTTPRVPGPGSGSDRGRTPGGTGDSGNGGSGDEAEKDREGGDSGDSAGDGSTGGRTDDGSSTGDRAGGGGSGGSDTGSRSPGSSSGTSSSEGTTAAELHGWGSPDREDDFSGGADQWDIYDGPGHAGEGTRSPSAVSVQDGMLTITGDSSGTTAGMAWNPGQKYGRWEGRVRAPASDPSYNALLLLWPDAEDFPVGGEIDFMEMMDHTRQTTDIFVHYGADNSQVNGKVEVDATEWHNWAVEWTPDAITAYVDGEEWYRTTDTSIFPPGPMHLCIQLDWFPKGGTPEESQMHVDWVRQYSLDGAGSSDTSGKSDRSGDSSSDDNDSGSRGSADEGGTGTGAETGEDTGEDAQGQDDPGTRLREAVRRLFSWR